MHVEESRERCRKVIRQELDVTIDRDARSIMRAGCDSVGFVDRGFPFIQIGQGLSNPENKDLNAWKDGVHDEKALCEHKALCRISWDAYTVCSADFQVLVQHFLGLT